MGTTSSNSIGVAALVCVFALLLGGAAPSVNAQSTTYLLQMPLTPVAPGEPFALPIEGDWVEAVSGFQLSISYPTNAPMSDIDVTVENSLVGALEPEFIQFNFAPGEIVGGVLFEIIVPFEGIVLPSVGFPLLLAEITGTTPEDAEEQVVAFFFEDGLGTPPLNNTFVVDFNSVTPDVLTNGGIDIRHPPGGGPQPLFVRGDVNSDSNVDLGDAIFHLNYTFGNGALPVCLDAGDANDDGSSDVSDAIFILAYNFYGGPMMHPPFPDPGPDPTPDDIGCEQSLEPATP